MAETPNNRRRAREDDDDDDEEAPPQKRTCFPRITISYKDVCIDDVVLPTGASLNSNTVLEMAENALDLRAGELQDEWRRLVVTVVGKSGEQSAVVHCSATLADAERVLGERVVRVAYARATGPWITAESVGRAVYRAAKVLAQPLILLYALNM